jgi:hypothetical protein
MVEVTMDATVAITNQLDKLGKELRAASINDLTIPYFLRYKLRRLGDFMVRSAEEIRVRNYAVRTRLRKAAERKALIERQDAPQD